MILLRILLFPLAAIYDGVTRLRNHLFNIGHRRSFRFEVPVIGVGNLNVGGSGKTPMIEYLIRNLIAERKISILSRGYGRVTRGLRFANDQETARTFGDEPLQFYRSFKNDVKVVVCEDRAFAIPNILQEFPDTNLVLLDDAFQHRSVSPHLNILLTEYSSPFYSDHIMPMGKLREARSGAARADIVVITKCPAEFSPTKMDVMKSEVQKWAGDKSVFFSSIRYGKPVSFGKDSQTLTNEVILLSGIANHSTFELYAQENYKVVKHFSFNDHHRYTKEELTEIKNYARNCNRPISLLTTEKDMVRLIDPEFSEFLNEISWFYVPIETFFIKDGAEFVDQVKLAIR